MTFHCWYLSLTLQIMGQFRGFGEVRNGLTFWETFWDQDVFWGELWFNLLLITLISGILLMKFPTQSPNIWRLSSKQQRILMYLTSSISLGIPILMLLTTPIRVDIFGNWYITQFAYQLPMWPALIGFLLIFIWWNSEYKHLRILEKFQSRLFVF